MVQSAQFLSTDGSLGVILNTALPFATILDLFQKRGLPVQNFFFIDAVSRQSGGAENPQAVFLTSCSALTEMSVAFQEVIASLATTKKSFFLINSLSMMAIHNPPDALARFVHFTLTKMRLSGIGGLIFSAKGQLEPDVRAELAQLCDRTLSCDFLQAPRPK